MFTVTVTVTVTVRSMASWTSAIRFLIAARSFFGAPIAAACEFNKLTIPPTKTTRQTRKTLTTGLAAPHNRHQILNCTTRLQLLESLTLTLTLTLNACSCSSSYWCMGWG